MKKTIATAIIWISLILPPLLGASDYIAMYYATLFIGFPMAAITTMGIWKVYEIYFGKNVFKKNEKVINDEKQK